MLKKNILWLIIIVIVIISVVKVGEFFKTHVVEADATKFVIEDLHSKYPKADIEIISVQEFVNEKNEKYFEIKAKVTNGQGGPCPERVHLFYNYPIQNFVPRQPEIITTNCSVCSENFCVLAFPEEALIASHTFPGTEDVASYLRSYNDVYGVARDVGDGWEVKWDSPSSSSYYIVNILKNNTVASVKKFDK
ncbi:MAG: hypothetical protein QXF35_00040 [Candidatus Bilamarchaeaceae archaeon]